MKSHKPTPLVLCSGKLKNFSVVFFPSFDIMSINICCSVTQSYVLLNKDTEEH